MTVHAEVMLVAGYALVLVGVAWGLDVLGRQSSPLVRWRADPDDGDRGEEEARGPGWPHSELRRFHRGVSVVVTTVAALFVGVELVRHHDPLEVTLLITVFVVVARAGKRAVAVLRASPANFEEA